MMSPTGVIALLLALSALINAAAIQHDGSDQDATSLSTSLVPDIHLEQQLLRRPLSESMVHALDLIKKVETMPSCNKIATSELLHSCSALNGSISEDDTASLKGGSDLFIEQEADLYSARLAVCELHGLPIPRECQAFVPNEKTAKKPGYRAYLPGFGSSKPSTHYQCYDDVTRSNLNECRKALYSTAQSWTSYSNSRQNAVVMCLAMRAEIDKDEQIHLAKMLANVVASGTGSLHGIVQDMNEMQLQFKDLSTAMPLLHRTLVAENEAALERVNKWADLESRQAEANTGMDGIITFFKALGIELQNSRRDMQDYTRSAEEVIANLMTATEDITTKHQSNADLVSTQTLAMADHLAYMNAQIQDLLTQGIGRAALELGLTTEASIALQSVLQQLASDMSTVYYTIVPAMSKELAELVIQSADMHQTRLRENEEAQKTANKTQAILNSMSEDAETISELLSTIAKICKNGWAGVVSWFWSVFSPLIYWIVGGFLAVPALRHRFNVSFINSILAALPIGLGFAFMCWRIEAFAHSYLPESFFDTAVEIWIACLLASIICGVGIYRGVVKMWTHYRGQQPYDPASPTCTDLNKWTV